MPGYNHYPDCTCAWCWKSGAYIGGMSSFRAVQIVDGFTWRFDRKPTYDSFVNPNASCPVCGASVYFYQSPFGGRVFFDELGPPWPKHPCTDNGPSSGARSGAREVVFEPSRKSSLTPPPLYRRDQWRPLLTDEIVRVDDFDRVRIPKQERIPGAFFYVPAGWVGDAPSYWRWRASDPSYVEISCVRLIKEGDLQTETFSTPSWLTSNEEFATWHVDPNAAPSPKALNAIGWALSFAWRADVWKDRPSSIWHLGLPGVDFALAKTYFERAAVSGYWVALNNLAVMHRDGLGVQRDPLKAFALFQQAARDLDPTPLRHLANCYRDGIGCDPDPEQQAFIEELISLKEREQSATTS
jgi:hypothetical protein